MKCEYCSANITIEHEKCPYCNAPNPFYEAHRKDMAEYKTKYEKTTKEVVEKTNKFTKKTVYITVIAVLALLNVVAILVLANVNNITYAIARNEKKQKAGEYAALVKEYEESGDYLKIHALMDSKYEYYSKNPLLDYSMVHSASDYYAWNIQSLGYAIDNSFYGDEADFARKINSNLENMYEIEREMDEATIKKGRYDESHLKAVKGMIEENHIMICAYLGIDKAVADEFRDMSSSKRQLLIEEAAKEVFFGEY